MVLDGSTGQNAFEQAGIYKSYRGKCFGYYKIGWNQGGVVIGVSDQFKIP